MQQLKLCIRLLVVIAAAAAWPARAYYVPGTYPREFARSEVLQAQVNSLTSFETDLPFDYYTMPFCTPPEGVRAAGNSANLGTVLMGIRLENSPYNFSMMVTERSKLACGEPGYREELTAKEVKNFKHKIDNHYRINLVLDNLPVTIYDLSVEDQEFIRPGFELGTKVGDKYYVFNHLIFSILVHETHGEYRAATAAAQAAALSNLDSRHHHFRHRRMLLAQQEEERFVAAAAEKEAAAAAGGKGAALAPQRRLLQDEDDDVLSDAPPEANATSLYMVVGFEVAPCSVKRKAGKEPEAVSCTKDDPPEPQEIKEGEKIVYTYDVYWVISPTRWASRWDAYLRMPGGKVHWFSIMNSILIVLVMATLVATILIRTVRRDLAKYEQLMVDGGGDLKDEAGWKLLTGDAFRAPAFGKNLCVQFGSGVQMLCVAFVTLLLATLGFLSPASRGALLTTTIVLYVLLAFLSGAAASVLWGVMERSYAGWVGVSLHVAFFLPGIIMVIFTLLNIALAGTGSLGAVPAGMYFTIVAVWFLVSVPLTFVGGYMGTKVPIINFPVKTNQIPRQIPPPPLVAHPILLFFSAGILPFGTMFIELYFAMTSMWLGWFYYLFGFVFIIGMLTLIINAEIAVLCTYVQLCAEDYQWWWHSFFRGGSVAFYVALYALGFLARSLNNLSGFLSVFQYLCYMCILTLGLYMSMATVGFAASFAFVYAIFAAVKQD